MITCQHKQLNIYIVAKESGNRGGPLRLTHGSNSVGSVREWIEQRQDNRALKITKASTLCGRMSAHHEDLVLKKAIQPGPASRVILRLPGGQLQGKVVDLHPAGSYVDLRSTDDVIQTLAYVLTVKLK
jgi:hypothetical protein